MLRRAHCLLQPFCAGAVLILMLRRCAPRDKEFPPNRLLEVRPAFREQTVTSVAPPEIGAQ